MISQEVLPIVFIHLHGHSCCFSLFFAVVRLFVCLFVCFWSVVCFLLNESESGN